MSAADWPTANTRRHALIVRSMGGDITPAEADELAALQARADDEVRPGLAAALRRLDGPPPVTFPIALAGLRAELGEPTEESHGCASWLRPGSTSEGVSLVDDGAAVWVGACDRSPRCGATWTLAGRATRHAPTSPLADAVRDAGAWLRGRRG